jgi:hypothetical protein
LSGEDLGALFGILLKLAGRVQGISVDVAAGVGLFADSAFRAFKLESALGLFLRLFVFVSELGEQVEAGLVISFAPLIFFEISFGRYRNSRDIVHGHGGRVGEEQLLVVRGELAD